MLTKTNLTEARGIAKLNTHTDFQKKQLIKFYLKISDIHVNVYQIPEDHPDFEKLFENVLNYFRNESIQETTSTERSAKKRLGE